MKHVMKVLLVVEEKEHHTSGSKIRNVTGSQSFAGPWSLYACCIIAMATSDKFANRLV